jgi:hypothetical protein
MADVTNDQLMTTLLDIKSDIGALTQKATGTHDWLAAHVEDDKLLIKTVTDLQISHAKQSGALKMLGILGAAVGSGIGYVVDRLTFGHHG